MGSYGFWRVDVFTDRPLTGNPLAVFPDGKGLTDEQMLAITREMNISETTFVLPSKAERADYRNRIFTPGGELPFAGHPSLGTAFVAAEEGIVPKREGVSTIHQEVGIGVLPLDLHISGGVIRKVVMTQGRPSVGRKIVNVDGIARALRVRPRDITATGLRPQVASTGIPSLQIPLRSVEIVQNLAPDPARLSSVLKRIHRDAGAYVFAFVAGDNADLHARAFFPNQGIVEDPATGSAAGACGAYLAANRRLPTKDQFVIEQGTEIQHQSRIEVAVTVKGSRPTAVRVGGQVVPVMRGTLALP